MLAFSLCHMTPEECVVCEWSWVCQGTEWLRSLSLGQTFCPGERGVCVPLLQKKLLPLDSRLAYKELANRSCQASH